MTPLNIAAFFDGRPGHEKQTLGLIRALERRTPVAVKDHRPETDSWPAVLASAARRVLKTARTSSGRVPDCDLILGTGSRIHLTMLAAKRTNGGRAVTCMTPNFPLMRFFDLCLVPFHDRIRPGANVIRTIGPPNPLRPGHAQDPGRGLILVGGIDPKSHVWDTTSVVEKIHRLVTDSPGLLWTISSSPRTLEETEDRLARLADGLSHVRFFRARETPAGWIEAAYARSAVAWVTADSISMVYEALSAGCRVGILPVAWRRRGGKMARSEKYLLARGMVTAYDAWLARSQMTPAGAALDEAGRCAEEILKRWWPDRLR